MKRKLPALSRRNEAAVQSQVKRGPKSLVPPAPRPRRLAVAFRRETLDLVRMQNTAELASANRHLKQGIIRRKKAEGALRKNGKHNAKLLRESYRLQQHLRHLAHQLLSAQEAERKKISHELQDEIAQTLLGINVRLLSLKKAASGNAAGLTKEIASTQRVVEECIQSINRFAHELDAHQSA